MICYQQRYRGGKSRAYGGPYLVSGQRAVRLAHDSALPLAGRFYKTHNKVTAGVK